MWQNWIIGILGLWIILIVFVNFSTTLTKIILTASGLAIAFLSFWVSFIVKPYNNQKTLDSDIMPQIDRERE